MNNAEIKNVVLVGAGAIGAVYAARLHNHTDIAFAVAADQERISRYKDEPLLFNGVELSLSYFTPQTGQPVADLILIATKSSGLDSALELIRPLVGSQTIIMTLLNGISSEDIAANKYGREKVLYSYFIGHTSTRQSREVVQDGSYRTVFGEADNSQLSERVVRVKELFDKVGIKYRIDRNMISSMWQKFVINVGMNQTTAVLRCTYGQIRSNPFAYNFMVSMMEECAAIAAAKGVEGAGGMVEKGVELLYTLGENDGSSMYQDVMAGRATEVDLFASEVYNMGRQMGIPTPFNRVVESILKGIE